VQAALGFPLPLFLCLGLSTWPVSQQVYRMANPVPSELSGTKLKKLQWYTKNVLKYICSFCLWNDVGHAHCIVASMVLAFQMAKTFFLEKFWSLDIQMFSSNCKWVILSMRKHEWWYIPNLEIFSIEQRCQSQIPNPPIDNIPREWTQSIMATVFVLSLPWIGGRINHLY
jgi:hypothetical protein